MGEVFKHVEQYGGHICSQLRRMGASTDWSRQVLPRAVPGLQCGGIVMAFCF